jgi:hypothetical protein
MRVSTAALHVAATALLQSATTITTHQLNTVHTAIYAQDCTTVVPRIHTLLATSASCGIITLTLRSLFVLVSCRVLAHSE